ncbi:MAG: hypothetical protein IJU23_06115 [Proteobacteria bacterium]|nr:hypothetical protein [Pseudomonadota bacterium]
MKRMTKSIASLIGSVIGLVALLTGCSDSDNDPSNISATKYGPIRPSDSVCCADALNYEKCVERYDKGSFCESDCCENATDAKKCKQKLEEDGICDVSEVPVADYGSQVPKSQCCAEAISYEKCVERYEKSGYCESECCENTTDETKCKQKLEDDKICEAYEEKE